MALRLFAVRTSRVRLALSIKSHFCVTVFVQVKNFLLVFVEKSNVTVIIILLLTH